MYWRYKKLKCDIPIPQLDKMFPNLMRRKIQITSFGLRKEFLNEFPMVLSAHLFSTVS